MTFQRARTGTNRYAYDLTDSLEEAAEAYKRCRKMQSFIITDEGVEKSELLCGRKDCRKPLTVDEGNRCHYYPKKRAFVVLHYRCAWQSILEAVHEVEI